MDEKKPHADLWGGGHKRAISGLLWRTIGVWCFLITGGPAAEAQTNCATQHAAGGVFICYPNPTENRADSIIPDLFHLSAQANAGHGQLIGRYRVLIDSRLVSDTRLAIPVQNLSIETNLKSPFDSGSHTLQLVVAGVGSAEVSGLQMYPSKSGLCDPFSRFDPRICSISNTRTRLRWSPAESVVPGSGGAPADPFEGYLAYLRLYGQNLKSIEADAGDAVAVDAQGNTYVASHTLADVELRKYAPDGSITYDSLFPACGKGFLSVAALAVNSSGHAWIAGNTSACLPPSPNAFHGNMAGTGQMRGFVMRADTTKPSNTPIFLTYLTDGESRISALRVDGDGNAYVTGTAASLDFPHESLLKVFEDSVSPGTRLGFVSAINPGGSGLLWSSLLQDVQLTALALDGAGTIYVTGRVTSCQPPSGSSTPARQAKPHRPTAARPAGCDDDVLVAGLADRGRRWSYMARLGGSAEEEGRAISTMQGHWILVTGETASPDFPVSSAASGSPPGKVRPFVAALEPCRTGILYSRLLTEADSGSAPEIALAPVLDAFAVGFPEALAASGFPKAGHQPAASVLKASPCHAAAQ
jgi:hypothetical protein